MGSDHPAAESGSTGPEGRRRSSPRWGILLVVLALGVGVGALVGCCCARPGAGPVAAETAREPRLDTSKTVPPSVTSDTTTLLEMRNVHFRLNDALALEIHRLSGEMVPRGRSYVYFDDPSGYVIRMRSAEVGLTPESLQALLSRYVFGYEGAPLRVTRIAIEDSLLVQEGVLHKGVDIPFRMKARPSITEHGLIRLHPVSMAICGIPGQGLMDALGIELEDLLDLGGAEGVYVQGNDLLMEAQRVLPPPAIRARLVGVSVTPDELVQTFEADPAGPPIRPAPEPPRPDAENYMFYHGGTLRFGDLMLLGSELQIVDADPGDPFDFHQVRYRPQLLAGYSEATPSLGQVTHMPDYDDVAPSVEPGEELEPGG